MKKKKRMLRRCLTAVCILLSALSIPVSASQGTTYTYTISVNGDWIRTQEAYLASAVYMKDMDLNQPEDLFVFGEELYVADTGNGRIVVQDLKDGKVREITNDSFLSPSGIFVNEEKLYVADPVAGAVFICTHQGEVLHTILRPEDSPLMSSESIFKPVNVVVTEGNNLFVVGEGSYDGLMQFDESGEFQGYFAANSRNLTLLERIQEMIFTRQQKEQLLTRKPRAIENIDISRRDLIYSVTQSAEVSYAWQAAEEKTSNALKLPNMAGVNILSPDVFMDDEWNFVDVAAGPYGNSYALTYTGLVYEYDSSGELIFSFGGRAVSNDRYGLFTNAAAIDLDPEGFIYVLDQERGLIQVFAPTDFAVLTHRAIYDLENGNYEASEENWLDILELNGMSRIAHVGYGKSLLRQQRYGEALRHFKLANDRGNYSECFWEIRNRAIHANIGYAVAIAFVLIAVWIFARVFRKKKTRKYYNSYELREAPESTGKRLLWDLGYAGRVLRHPLDGIYYLKVGKRGSILSASVLILLGFAVYLLDILGRGFIFAENRLAELSPILLTLLYFIVILLFVAGNYMVSTINEGEGRLKNILVVLAYALVPYIILSLASIGCSYLFTLNEGFLLKLVWAVGVSWSGVLLFLGIMHTHNYSFGQTIKNILLTLAFAVVALVVVAILYLVWDKVIVFANEVISEVIYRVQN